MLLTHHWLYLVFPYLNPIWARNKSIVNRKLWTSTLTNTVWRQAGNCGLAHWPTQFDARQMQSSCVILMTLLFFNLFWWFWDSCMQINALVTAKSKQNQNKYLYHFLDFLQVEYCILFWSAMSTPNIRNLVATAWKDKKVVTYLSTNCDPTESRVVQRRKKDGTLFLCTSLASAWLVKLCWPMC
jgi:hypothetical protein